MTNERWRNRAAVRPRSHPPEIDSLVRYAFAQDASITGRDCEIRKAVDLLTDMTVAVKLTRVDRVGEPDLHERLRNEAMIGARLGHTHPNILGVLDFGLVGDCVFLTTEWIEGGSLRPLCGRLALNECLTILSQCAAAVRAAHRESVTHTDICPENILYIAKERRAMLGDFGLATTLQGHAAWLGRENGFSRRPHYLPPQGHPAHPPPSSKALDTYALAVMLGALLTGHEQDPTEDHGMIIGRSGTAVPKRIVNLIARYTLEGKADDDAEGFMSDLWKVRR